MEYHTWQLPSEKLLHVVLGGVPEPIDEEGRRRYAKNRTGGTRISSGDHRQNEEAR